MGQNAKAEDDGGDEDEDDEDGGGTAPPAAASAASAWLGGPYIEAWLPSLENLLWKKENQKKVVRVMVVTPDGRTSNQQLNIYI